MLEGVVGFPPEFAARYREKGYWEDRSLSDTFQEICQRHSEKIVVIDRGREITYQELDEISSNLALNLLDHGLKPLDRVVVQLPNVIEFVFVYLALQKMGCIPILVLVTHRYQEVSQFVDLTKAVACIALDTIKDFSFTDLIRRIRSESKTLRLGITLGEQQDDMISLSSLIENPSQRPLSDLNNIKIDPNDPCVFLLSGGTTGIPKLIPRTHNDYVYNSKTAASVCDIREGDVLLDILPIAHNLPLACPGLQGFMLKGQKVVLGQSTRAIKVFELVEKYRVTHIHVVPALLIKWINDPMINQYDLSSLRVIQSGGQSLQPEVRLLTKKLIPSVTVQENFGMSEGVLMFVRLDDPEDVRLATVGRPMSPDDEIRILGENDNEVVPGEVGELCCRGPYTLRGYFATPEYNKKAFTNDGFYRSGDLMFQHPSGNYIVAGRKKDLINRGGEKISAEEVENLILSHDSVQNVACVPYPDDILGEKMCACLIIKNGRSISLNEMSEFLLTKEIAKHKFPERIKVMEAFPLSTFGKVSKKALSEKIIEEIKLEQ